jgi:hypothetical protein
MSESFGVNHIGPKHLKRTADWVRTLRKDADEALVVAALCHDIERSEKHIHGKVEKLSGNITGEDYLRNHQERSGRIMHDFLIQAGADSDFAERVEYLISKHEVGGDDDQNLLKDADSVSFFENNIDYFIENIVQIIGKEELVRKFQWMYERITLKKAEEAALPFYLHAMKRAEKIKSS